MDVPASFTVPPGSMVRDLSTSQWTSPSRYHTGEPSIVCQVVAFWIELPYTSQTLRVLPLTVLLAANAPAACADECVPIPLPEIVQYRIGSCAPKGR